MRRTPPTALALKEEKGSHKFTSTKNGGQLLKTEKERKWNHPWSLREGGQSCQHLDFGPGRSVSFLTLQNCKT